MKKILLLIIIGFGIIGCGINCSGKPPKRAYFHQDKGYDMRYHISLYFSAPIGSHSVSVKCTEYEYVAIHIYVDDVGVVKGDSIIWKNGRGDEFPLEENGDQGENITVGITNDTVTVNGFQDNKINGTYKVETTSPDSWGEVIH